MTGREKIVINADDVGISPGSIGAVRKAADNNALNSISIMTNGEYFPQVVSDIIRADRKIAFGVHLNLTYGRSLTASTRLAANGLFNKGFIGLVLGAYSSQSLREDIEQEFEAQIRKLQEFVEISHLDSHRHVHMIPPIFKIVCKLAEKHHIPEVRVANEKIIAGFIIGGNPRFLIDGGLIKALLLKFFSNWCRYPASRPFFSLLYTGKINRKMIEKLFKYDNPVEVGIHPGIPEQDLDAVFFSNHEAAYWRSADRNKEFEALNLGIR